MGYDVSLIDGHIEEPRPKEAKCMINKKQMKLTNFCKEFDIARTTAIKWIHSDGFPAYNLCGHWYVDIDKFYRWRDLQHKKSYKYV